MSEPRARDFGLIPGSPPTGAANAITDVAGVRVGHFTRREGEIATGFTAILPHGGNLFREKVPAAVSVLNGFGKSAGLMQVEELGSIETPILLTNTFAVGTGFSALVRDALAQNPEIGRDTGTVNPLVCECNDGYLNDIRAMALTEADAAAALAAARTADGPPAQGAVGAGAGMSCFGFKGGIGTASRVFDLDGRGFTLGALVLANFGKPGDLLLPDGRRPHPDDLDDAPERGSIIVVLATDAPLATRQLRRIAQRGGAGIAWLGAFWGHGSGDIALAFSTARRLPHAGPAILAAEEIAEDRIDAPFRAAAEATQEAILNALCAAPRCVGRDGHVRPSLADWLKRENRE